MRPSDTITFPVFKPIVVARMRTEQIPPREFLLAPWLVGPSLTLLHGPRGIGKTHLALAIAHAIASGTDLLGWHAPAPRRVLIIDGEMPIEDLQIACAALPIPEHEENLRLLAMDIEDYQLDLTQYSHRFRLEEHLNDVDLIVIDNLATLAYGGAENAAETWQPIELWAINQRRAGRAVLFVHHSGRLGHQRGTTRREDRMDTILALRPAQADPQAEPGARFELHLQKHRGTLPLGTFPILANLTADGWRAAPLPDDPRAEIITLTRAGLTIRAIAERTGLTPSTVNRLQSAARQLGQLATVPAVPPVPAVPNPVPSEMVQPC